MRSNAPHSVGELNALLNRPASSPPARPEDLALVPFEYALDALVTAATAHAPMLRRDRVMIDRSQLAVDAARKEYKPDFARHGGYYYMGAMPSMYEFRFDVKVPLRRDRRAAAVAEQLSSLQAARSTYDSSRLSLQGRLQEDYQMASTSVRLATLYRETVLPQARLALESSMASYQTGAVDFLSVLTNFGSVLEYEMTYFDELTAFHMAVSRLEEMTGTRWCIETAMKTVKASSSLLVIALAFGGGYVVRATRQARPVAPRAPQDLYYVDPMHPRLQVRQAGRGAGLRHDARAGVRGCGVPADKPGHRAEDAGDATDAAAAAGAIKISPERQQLIGVKFATVELSGQARFDPGGRQGDIRRDARRPRAHADRRLD